MITEAKQCWLLMRGNYEDINENPDCGLMAVVRGYTPKEYLEMVGIKVVHIYEFDENNIGFKVKDSGYMIYAEKLVFIEKVE